MISPQNFLNFNLYQNLAFSPSQDQIEGHFSTKESDFEEEKVDYNTLIKFHKIYGNKWKQISGHLPNTTDAFIKNMFYTLTRKALRKINLYIQLNSKKKDKKVKVFKLNFVFKLANLAESERISHTAPNQNISKHYYTKLLYDLLKLGKQQHSTFQKLSKGQLDNFDEQSFKEYIDSLIASLRTIQKIFIQQNLTKKGRTKKKFPKRGLIQKAFSSKAFKDSMNDSETFSFDSISSSHSLHEKQEQREQFSETQSCRSQNQLQMINDCQLVIKDQFNNYFQEKTYDPLLFH